MSNITRIKVKTKNPKLNKLYSKYDEITIEDCEDLLNFLYEDKDDYWVNPITTKEINRSSDIIISFLSKLYYQWGDNKKTINSLNLTYKEHILKFIDVDYLFDVSSRVKKNSSPRSPQAAQAAQSPRSPQAAQAAQAAQTARGQRVSPTLPAFVPVSPSKVAYAGTRAGYVFKTGSKGLGYYLINKHAGVSGNNSPRSPNSPQAARGPRISPTLPAFIPATSYSGVRQGYVFHMGAQGLGYYLEPGAGSGKSPRSLHAAYAAQVAQAAQAALLAPKPLSFKPKTVKDMNKNSDLLSQMDCIFLVEEIEQKILNKTPAQLKNVKVMNPITNKEIGLDSIILQSYLSKCYYTNYSPKLKNMIEKLVNINELIDLEKQKLLEEKKKEEERLKREKAEEEKRKRIPTITKQIDTYIEEFNNCCDELVANCDANGVLNEHKYIANIVNAIMVIIYTTFMHLDHLYLGPNIKKDSCFRIFMYDDELLRYYTAKQLDTEKEFLREYENYYIIYQHNSLLYIPPRFHELVAGNMENRYLNTLLNRQYVFSLDEYDNTHPEINYNAKVLYNVVNQIQIANVFHNSKFKGDLQTTLAFPKLLFTTINPTVLLDYNMTNGVLPKYIFCNNTDMSKYFADLIDIINKRLQTLPTITKIKREKAPDVAKYNPNEIIKNMELMSFGDSIPEYGGKDMIRKNILTSLNSQDPDYVKYNFDKFKEVAYYNQEYTGSYPIFTWIPINKNFSDNVNFRVAPFFWQPFEIDKNKLRKIDAYYKNNGISPFSRWLNETIFKVITDEYTSVKSLTYADRIRSMQERVVETIGNYKDLNRKPNYKLNKIYLYHGTRKRLETIVGKDNDIEVLGFLSTSFNVQIASRYCGLNSHNSGIIYIIEVDDTKSYINLNDQLQQILILPFSRIKIVMEFNVGEVLVILCKLIKTPSNEQNNKLYNKILDIAQPAVPVNKYVSYTIKTNDNIMPECAYILGEHWEKDKISGSNKLGSYLIERSKLNNNRLNNKAMPKKVLDESFLYFSLGKEYELYVERGIPLISGSYEDIKYSIHQHFIKDCYKALGIPCLDYIFFHATQLPKEKVTATQPFIKNDISTGILEKDYRENRIPELRYNINNFFIDCIFKFDSIKIENKMVNIPNIHPYHLTDPRNTNKYADKIEGFRDAGLYMDGVLDPTIFNQQLFNTQLLIGEHIQYIRKWNPLFAKYKEASNEELKNHFIWCNGQIDRLIDIIVNVKEHYLKFINETLKGNTGRGNRPQKETFDQDAKETKELNDMINDLVKTLLRRALFYNKCTNKTDSMPFIRMIKTLLDECNNNNLNILYQNAVVDDLILKSDAMSGGIHSMSQIKKLTMTSMAENAVVDVATASAAASKKDKSDKATKAIDHMEIYEAYKNVPIRESKDMQKFSELPKAFKEYYKGGANKDGYIDISNHCYCRSI
jgi:hypothetical protein